MTSPRDPAAGGSPAAAGLPPARDHFDRLGVPRRYDLDFADLEQRYLALSRDVHPDFHRLERDADRQASVESSALLNQAYATLRDPFRRAEYLVTLEGGPTAAAHKDTDPGFLEEMLELRLEIETARESGAEPARQDLERLLGARLDGVASELGPLFGRDDPGRLAAVRRRLNAAKYLQGLLRDLRAD